MPGQSLFVGGPADTDRFLSMQDARLALSGLLATNSADPMDVRLGVLWSGDQVLITGTAGLNVTVDALGFVSSKGSANGAYVGNSRAAVTVAVPAAPALGSKRLDVLWVQQQDKGATVSADAATQAVFGTTAGTATTGAPAKNAIPAGAQEVGTILWDSTSTVASATNAAQCTLATTCQWTTTRGNPIPVRSQTERDALTPFAGMEVRRLDLGYRVQRYSGSAWGLMAGSVQTGTADLAGDATNQRFVDITFGDAFPAAPVIMLQELTGMSGSSTTQNVWPSAITTTGFRLNGVRNNTTTVTVRWVATYLG